MRKKIEKIFWDMEIIGNRRKIPYYYFQLGCEFTHGLGSQIAHTSAMEMIGNRRKIIVIKTSCSKNSSKSQKFPKFVKKEIPIPSPKRANKNFFRLFPIISISQKFFSIFFLTLEKIGIDEKVICYHNISN